jgi:hypothetical protein
MSFAGYALLTFACKPDLVGRPSTIDEDVVLAIRSFPAEVKPDDSPPPVVTYEALYVGPEGAIDSSGMDWAFCDQSKPLAVTGPIAPACLVRRAADITVSVSSGADGAAPMTETRHVLTPFGNGLSASSPPPADGCRVFGPFPPDPVSGQPQARPADPDTTGGYYQPVRLLVPTRTGDQFAVGITRLDCGIAGATPDQATEYSKRHRPNQNPALLSLVVTHANGRRDTVPPEPGGSPAAQTARDAGMASDGGDSASSDGGIPTLEAGASRGDSGVPSTDAGAPSTDAGSVEPVTVSQGESVVFRATWAACAAACNGSSCPPPKPCTGSESYVNLDLTARQLVDHRESIRISWFSSDGAFDHDRTGRGESDANRPSSDNAWTAPATTTDVHLWVVIRDDRGGVGWSTYVIHVTS